jgi:hypothetical protein
MSASKSLTLSPIVVLTSGFSGCKTQEREDPRTMPDLVRIATVHKVDQQNHAYTGVVTARIQSEPGFRVPGEIEK